MELLSLIAFLWTLGALAGFLAGLLGIGGGLVVVPGLYYLLSYFGYTEHAMHIAVGTSLMSIVLTSTSSAYAHYKKDAVSFDLLKAFIPGLLAGVVVGTILAGVISTIFLKGFFAISQLLFGGYMFFRKDKTALYEAMPTQPLMGVVSALISCFAVLKGVGGGVQNVMFMTLCNVPIKRAIGTASAVAPLQAFLGALGFVYIGWDVDVENLPPFNLGFVNLAAFVVIISASVLTAPLGVKCVHALPVSKLKTGFSLFMLLLAGKMLIEIILDQQLF